VRAHDKWYALQLNIRAMEHPACGAPLISDSTQTKVIFQVDDENTEPSSGTTPQPKNWKERFRWLAILMMAAFAGLGPAPPPRPARNPSEYAQIAEDPDESKLDSDHHFL